MKKNITLSVLDYGTIDKEQTPREALKASLYLAQEAEKLGFSRFLVAEHHDIAAFSTTSPELLMMHFADHTEKIKIGSGGIMPLHYSPYKVAELVRNLETIHPGRIDLGVGSTLGKPSLLKAMNSQHEREEYEAVLKELHAYLSPTHQKHYKTEELDSISVRPFIESTPGFFMLSSSAESAKIAGELGIGYCFGVFPFMPNNMYEDAKTSTETYRKHFKPSVFQKESHTTFACFITMAETDEEAELFARCLDVWMLGKLHFNEFKSYPTVEEALSYELNDEERARIASNRSRMVIGGPTRVKEQLDELLSLSDADELLAIPLVPGIENRKKTLELLAKLYL